MYQYLTPFIRNEAQVALFDLLEDHAYRILTAYLNEYAWNDEAKRLTESRFVGVGTYRLLTHVATEYLDGSIEEAITFYERSKRPKDDPHYEDLIVLFLMQIGVVIIARLLYEKLPRKVHSLENSKELVNRIWSVFGRGINYLFRGRWTREMHWHKQLSKEEYAALLEYLREEYLGQVTPSKDDLDLDTLSKAESEWQVMAIHHGLELADLPNSLIIKLIDFFSELTERPDLLEEFKVFLNEHGEHENG